MRAPEACGLALACAGMSLALLWPAPTGSAGLHVGNALRGAPEGVARGGRDASPQAPPSGTPRRAFPTAGTPSAAFRANRDARPEDKDRAAIDAAIRHAMKTWNVPGVAVVVVRDDRVVYLQGHGVREVGKK